MRRLHLLAMIAVATVFTGCQGPCCLPPAGPMNYQQSRAVINDPFPIDDLGPNDATMRPPGFEQPLPEPVRARIVKDTMPQLMRP